MNKNWKLFTIVTVVIALIAFAGVTAVFAQGPNQPAIPGAANQGTNQPAAPASAANQEEARGGMGYMTVEEADMHAAIAGALGISVEQLEIEIAAGKTIDVLAQELGVEFAVVQAAMDTVHGAAMQEAVDNGTISQEQADWVQSRRGGQQNQGSAVSNGANGSPMRGTGQVNRGANNGLCVYETP